VDSTSRVRLVLKKFSLGAKKALDKIPLLCYNNYESNKMSLKLATPAEIVTQKKRKPGRPKLPKGEGKGKILAHPVYEG